MQERSPESTAALIAAALREGGAVLGRTVALARDEIDGNLRALAGLLVILGTIVVLVVAAFFVFLDALVKALAVLVGSEPVAAILVASPFAVAAAVLATLGVRRIARATSLPRRAADRLGADVRSVLPTRS